MDFAGRGRNKRFIKNNPSVEPSKVNLYQEIPNVEVSLDDFEEFALDRLKVKQLTPDTQNF